MNEPSSGSTHALWGELGSQSKVLTGHWLTRVYNWENGLLSLLQYNHIDIEVSDFLEKSLTECCFIFEIHTNSANIFIVLKLQKIEEMKLFIWVFCDFYSITRISQINRDRLAIHYISLYETKSLDKHQPINFFGTPWLFFIGIKEIL